MSNLNIEEVEQSKELEEGEIDETQLKQPEQSEKIKINIDNTIIENKANISDDDDDDDDDSDYEETVKLEDYIENDILDKYHPEIKNINNKELESLTKIVRDTNRNINDLKHQTIPIMTRYEKAKILGIRATQINSGADVFIDVSPDIIDGITIARMELEKKAIPFIIRRPLPNGDSEYWDISDLEILD